jgi:hypothetical protein
MTDAATIAKGLTKAREDWLLSLPRTLDKWHFSERFSSQCVDWCVNRNLAEWHISGEGNAYHYLTPLGLAVRAHLQETDR